MIKDVFLSTSPWRKKLLNRLENAYKTACDKKALSLFESLLFSHEKLCDLNCDLIRNFSKLLGIKTPFFMASKIIRQIERKAAHVLELCEGLGAKVYLSPPGAKCYLALSEEKFVKKEISVKYFDFAPFAYAQPNNQNAHKTGFVSI